MVRDISECQGGMGVEGEEAPGNLNLWIQPRQALPRLSHRRPGNLEGWICDEREHPELKDS